MEHTVHQRLSSIEQTTREHGTKLNETSLMILGDDRLGISGIIGDLTMIAQRQTRGEEKTTEIEGRTRATIEEIEREIFKIKLIMAVFAFCVTLALSGLIIFLLSTKVGFIP